MSKFIFAALLTLSSLLSIAPAAAQSGTRNQIQMIEQEYARQSNGRMIPDDQLEYYLDQSNAGWSMSQISQDMADSLQHDDQDDNDNNDSWRPQTGWVAREVVCTSIDNRYRDCAAPFSGRAVVTQQISASACIEGQSWGQKPGLIWVNHGCRARFGIVAGANTGNIENPRIIVCQSNKNRYRQCDTGIRGRVQLVKRLNKSAACISGRSWGQREGMVWVSRGCRAQFAAVGRPGRGDDGNGNNGNWNRDNNYAVTCSSTNNAQARCNWDARYGRPRIDEQLSQNACIEDRTWGYDNRNELWVNNGCRARFVSSHDLGGRDNNWNRDNNYSVTCSSQNKAMTRCNWDARYGNPRLVQQLSSQACVNGRNWGYENNRGIWVNGGCRARFAPY